MSKKEEKAEQYANQKVMDKNLYPCVEFNRRKQLTTFDAYELEDAFEAGWDAAVNKACEWLNNFYSEDRHCYLVAEDIKAFKQAMEE